DPSASPPSTHSLPHSARNHDPALTQQAPVGGGGPRNAVEGGDERPLADRQRHRIANDLAILARNARAQARASCRPRRFPANTGKRTGGSRLNGGPPPPCFAWSPSPS